MDRHILRSQAFSLVELAMAMGIVAILASAIVPVAIRAIEFKAVEKAVAEVGILQQAALNFFRKHRVWPASLEDLQQQGYLSPYWSLNNPWNLPYQLAGNAHAVEIQLTVPDHLTQALSVRLPQASVDGQTVRSVVSASAGAVETAGIIVAWSGSIADIPPGWVLCDGSNGTPDLRDRFIVGGRQDGDGKVQTLIEGLPRQTGGQVRHGHGGVTREHVLSIAEIPPHSHGYFRPLLQGTYDGHSSLLVTAIEWTQSERVGGGQGHSHAVTPDLHLPPYFALAFIMKLA